ncbi:DUF5331 domain-containing protein [Iningainema tapete]|uniref:Uncharacterized protein n=1 Tax=Iningainema tapete BLCC-T55 TaxID=2748662 RepID=A0A8J6XZV1_9CYAN|nr:DUF5331 domain-containing protein [Iningainema tapete]MBD2776368.1 hypothetical protein [Iningainema tapete BLCC-T55]
MEIQQLRQSVKLKWVSYYDQNRAWLVKMRIWGTYDDIRRPSSGFILATVSVLEPDINEIFPFILELNNNPDQIVAALGLNFNPEEHLHLIEPLDTVTNQSPTESQLETFHSDKLASGITPIDEPVSIAVAYAENKSFVSPMAVGTAFENKPLVPLAVYNDHNTPVVTAIATPIESQPITSVSVTKEVDNGIAKLHQKDTTHTHLPPVNKVRSLANWVDDFCQGVGSERENFTPFWRRQDTQDTRNQLPGEVLEIEQSSAQHIREKFKQYVYLSLLFSFICYLLTRIHVYS